MSIKKIFKADTEYSIDYILENIEIALIQTSSFLTEMLDDDYPKEVDAIMGEYVKLVLTGLFGESKVHDYLLNKMRKMSGGVYEHDDTFLHNILEIVISEIIQNAMEHGENVDDLVKELDELKQGGDKNDRH